MAQNGFDEATRAAAEQDSDASAYRDGYQRLMREMAFARDHGWSPSQRQLVVALTQVAKVYSAARGGKFIGGRRPEWLRGRADALRALLHQGVGAVPSVASDD